MTLDRPATQHRTPGELDALVTASIRKHLKPLDEFTHDQLAEISGLTVCAIKHSLDRLTKAGVVAAVRQVKIKWKRYRTVWQVLITTSDLIRPQRTLCSAAIPTQRNAPSA